MTISKEPNYKLPKGGNTEFDRLDVQHATWTLLLDGLYPEGIKERVEELMENSRNPEVLDVGCGSGIWSCSMAEQFPQAKVTGLDVTPLGEGERPPNFSFKHHDIMGGFPPEYKGKFDIIHCRMVCQHVKGPQRLVDSMAGCLKPGGLLLICDGDFSVSDENRKLLKPFEYNPSLSIEENLKNPEGGSWHSGWLNALGSILRPAEYELPEIMVKKSPSLKEVMVKEYWGPFGWEGDKEVNNGKEVGEVIMKNFTRLYEITRPLFAKWLENVPDEIREAWLKRGFQELQTRKMYLLSWVVVATTSNPDN